MRWRWRRSGKQAMAVPSGTEAAVCAFVEGDCVAVIGETASCSCLLSARFRSSRAGAASFCSVTRMDISSTATELRLERGVARCQWPHLDDGRAQDWRGARAQAGRLAPTRLRAIGQIWIDFSGIMAQAVEEIDRPAPYLGGMTDHAIAGLRKRREEITAKSMTRRRGHEATCRAGEPRRGHSHPIARASGLSRPRKHYRRGVYFKRDELARLVREALRDASQASGGRRDRGDIIAAKGFPDACHLAVTKMIVARLGAMTRRGEIARTARRGTPDGPCRVPRSGLGLSILRGRDYARSLHRVAVRRGGHTSRNWSPLNRRNMCRECVATKLEASPQQLSAKRGWAIPCANRLWKCDSRFLKSRRTGKAGADHTRDLY